MIRLLRKLFDYTPWQIVGTYSHSGVMYAVQMRQNNRTGLKKFKTTRITGIMHYCAWHPNAAELEKA